jgi:uncharacterized coiled-coil protein SlyX
MDEVIAELVKQRQDIVAMQAMVTEMHAMMCQQQESITALLNKRLEFTPGVYPTYAKSKSL